MAKPSIAEVSGQVFSLLEPLDPAERKRILQATAILFGDTITTVPATEEAANRSHISTPQIAPLVPVEAAAFFDLKKPKTKIEEIAVAARFLENSGKIAPHTQEQLKNIFTNARHTFDGNNFRRDIDNARRKGLFIRSGETDQFTLSHSGQKYVDILPNREALKELHTARKPKRKSGKKKIKK